MRVLLVEDEVRLAENLAAALREARKRAGLTGERPNGSRVSPGAARASSRQASASSWRCSRA